jgi:hypothetical protein
MKMAKSVVGLHPSIHPSPPLHFFSNILISPANESIAFSRIKKKEKTFSHQTKDSFPSTREVPELKKNKIKEEEIEMIK